MNLRTVVVRVALGALLSCSIFLARCTREFIQPVNSVCFEQEVLPIFVSNCTQSGCHNSRDRVEGLDFSSYDGILAGVIPGDYRGSVVYHAIISGFGGEAMPPKPYQRLTSEQIQTIALWIDEGAQPSTCEGAGCDTSSVVSYSQDIAPIMAAWCAGCHSGSSPSGGITCSTVAGLRAVASNGRLVGAIEQNPNYSPMPQGGKLPSCHVALIKKWVAEGTPDN